jgi:hypothetical protein
MRRETEIEILRENVARFKKLVPDSLITGSSYSA